MDVWALTIVIRVGGAYNVPQQPYDYHLLILLLL